jgi:hypothetical protein
MFYTFLNLFLQWFVVLIVNVISIPVKFTPRYLIFLSLLQMELFSYILSQTGHCLCIARLLIFVN